MKISTFSIVLVLSCLALSNSAYAPPNATRPRTASITTTTTIPETGIDIDTLILLAFFVSAVAIIVIVGLIKRRNRTPIEFLMKRKF